jgi:hypothetical protein
MKLLNAIIEFVIICIASAAFIIVIIPVGFALDICGSVKRGLLNWADDTSWFDLEIAVALISTIALLCYCVSSVNL